MQITPYLTANLAKNLQTGPHDYFIQRKENKDSVTYIAHNATYENYNAANIEKENIKRHTISELLKEYADYLNGVTAKPVNIAFVNTNFSKTIIKTCAKYPITST